MDETSLYPGTAICPVDKLKCYVSPHCRLYRNGADGCNKPRYQLPMTCEQTYVWWRTFHRWGGRWGWWFLICLRQRLEYEYNIRLQRRLSSPFLTDLKGRLAKRQ